MKMKKLLVTGILALALTVTGCAGGNQNNAAATTNPSATTTGNSSSAPITDDKKPVNVPIAGQAASGLLSLVGEAVNEMVRREYPGSNVAYEPGNMAGDLVEIAEGTKYPLTLGVASIAVEMAIAGKAPFPKKFDKNNFKTVATITENMQTHVFASKEFIDKYKIKTLSDIKTNKVPAKIATNQPGNLMEHTIANALLEGHGITRNELNSWGGKVLDIPNSESYGLYADGRVDIIIVSTWPPDQKILEASRVKDSVLVPMSKKVVDNFVKEYNGKASTIKAGAYEFLKEDYYTVGSDLLILAGHLADNQLTYKVAKGIYNHYDYYQKVHPVFKQFNKEMLSKPTGYDLHPGAEQFYKEVGLMK
ncbi:MULTISPECIES: TAXI family TRAP transporter solute-binding subunit [unclassified Paenibacillus]|uniref:TAXI family TRAP transporter solute-binding subunit n=1 Tax=unclassified Paenibacillus TaxID=185978 RepID=UPI001AE56F7D|nr:MULTISPECIES: TAXI family TRAP transporter solute-binding subunit [unclassified Paenibacillus]MBP1154059.1 TRAP transporter TAXI family solute receptor [Paenibacillus sp. PvP091]MBP1170556.1 TRAP transporter TAXI family solute receptor [Paenibacillus sp. PvR098]MBP2441584.1 TRAP transporter TAXI family solute receptor [Paenibacillus sp. PvP052]